MPTTSHSLPTRRHAHARPDAPPLVCGHRRPSWQPAPPSAPPSPPLSPPLPPRAQAFEEVVPWASFALYLNRSQIPDLATILRDFPTDRLVAMRRSIACAWPVRSTA
eukprot:4499505-Prymnesium_polylepis.1